jgi:uracil-DNA glycosylase
VHPAWQPLVDAFFESLDGLNVRAFLSRRLNEGATIFPPQPLKALELTPLQSVHTVILGQDPYHGRGQAEGLAFSVAPGLLCLRRCAIFLKSDFGIWGSRFPLAQCRVGV